MSFTRIKVSKETSTKLNTLKTRTGLTPNILSRIAFCISLGESGAPDPLSFDEEGQEFNRYTLTGELDLFFVALLKERLVKDGLNPEIDLLPQFRAHINRGVSSLYTRVRNLPDLHDLIPREQSIKAHEKEFMVDSNDA